MQARPFVKWAGGKAQILPALQAHVPPSYRTYYEPFVGGGALFFALAPARAVLSDANLRLVRTWRAVRDNVEALIQVLTECARKHSPEFFYEIRATDPDKATSDVEVAAWFIYLNRTCFNGLYRVNSKGKFNVPVGRYVNPQICDVDRLRACSRALVDVELEWADFRTVMERPRRGDFVYFDPPYAPLSATSDFTSYTEEGFTAKDQADLRDVARKLKARGVHVLLSNSSAPLIRDLYDDGFHIETVAARRAVNSQAASRGPVAELIIR
jgi:DNA adenine methylase